MTSGTIASGRGDPVVGPRRSRSRRGEGEQLRAEILAAAERILIETNDQSALSIRAIAAAVGVTPPSIYLHFADRNDLVFAVCERHVEQLDRAMAEAAEGVDDPWERLRQRGKAYLQWGLDNPEHYRILMTSRPDQTPDRLLDERIADTAGLDACAADIASAIATGLLVPEGDARSTAELLWMMIHGMVSLRISKPEFPFGPVDEVYDRMFDLAYRGLALPAQSRPAQSRPAQSRPAQSLPAPSGAQAVCPPAT